MRYKIETKYFALDEEFLYFLRSRFCYKKILLSEIDDIVIRKRNCFKNRLFILLAGILFLVISTLIIISSYDSLINILPGYYGGKASWIAVSAVLMTFLFGIVLVVQSLLRNYAMEINHSGQMELLCLREVMKNDDIKVLIDLLNDKVKKVNFEIELIKNKSN